MKRFIVEIRGDLNPFEAFQRCMKVAEKGLISNNGKQHCYATTFGDGSMVFTVLNKGSERFVVSKQK